MTWATASSSDCFLGTFLAAAQQRHQQPPSSRYADTVAWPQALTERTICVCMHLLSHALQVQQPLSA